MSLFGSNPNTHTHAHIQIKEEKEQIKSFQHTMLT